MESVTRWNGPGSSGGGRKLTPSEAKDKIWEFIKAIVHNYNFTINDVLDTDFDSLLRLISKPKKERKVHSLFEFVEKGGN